MTLYVVGILVVVVVVVLVLVLVVARSARLRCRYACCGHLAMATVAGRCADTNAMAGLEEFHFWGYIVSRFLSAVDSDARADYKRRHPSKPRHVMDAKGAAARGGQAAACLFLARDLTFPIQVECKAVSLVVKAARRKNSRQAPALGPRIIFVPCWLTEHGECAYVRCHAAGWLALVHFTLRLINAERA